MGKKKAKTFSALLSSGGAPLAIPMDDERLIDELAQKRESSVEFAEVVEIQCKKYKDVNGATLFIDTYQMIFIRSQKVFLQVHVYDIAKVECIQTREITISFNSDHPDLIIRTHWSHEKDNADQILKCILQMWKYSFPSAPKSVKPFKIEPPSKWNYIDQIEDEEDIGPCGGIIRSYTSLCLQKGVEIKREVAESVSLIANQTGKKLSLNDFSNLTEEDMTLVVRSATYNTYFTTFIGLGRQVGTDLQAAIINLILLNSNIREVVISSLGLGTNLFKEVKSKAESGQGKVEFVSLDISNNPLEEKGVEALSDLLGSLNYGLTKIAMSNVGAKKSCTNMCVALRKNTNLFVTLTNLDLSYNKFDNEATNSLASWLANPNTLEILNLASTGVLIDKISDALQRGSSTNLCSLNVSSNKIKNLDKLSQFVKSCQALNDLNISGNPVEAESLFSLVRNIMVNYTLIDFKLIIREIGLDAAGAEILMGMLSHNIKYIDVSENSLGPGGLQLIGNALSANTCLNSLILDHCFEPSRKEDSLPAHTFGQFLRFNRDLKTLSLKANDQSALKGELIPILEGLTANTTLLELNISGHQGGDAVATALGRFLQINNTLRSLEIDDNAISLIGFQRIRDGLMRNTTLQQMTIPVVDAMLLRKKGRVSSVGTISGSVRGSTATMESLPAIVRDIETRLAQNYSRPKSTATKTLSEEKSFKFINAAKQKEIDMTIHRIRATGKNPSQKDKDAFSDASVHSSALTEIQTTHEQTQIKLKAEIDKLSEDFADSLYKIISTTHEQFKTSMVKYIEETYKGLGEESISNIKKTLEHDVSKITQESVKEAVKKTCSEIISHDTEITTGMLKEVSRYLYDSISSNLQSIYQQSIQETIKREISDSPILK